MSNLKGILSLIFAVTLVGLVVFGIIDNHNRHNQPIREHTLTVKEKDWERAGKNHRNYVIRDERGITYDVEANNWRDYDKPDLYEKLREGRTYTCDIRGKVKKSHFTHPILVSCVEKA